MKNILISHIDLDGVGSIILKEYFNLPFDTVYMFDYNFETTPKGELALMGADQIFMADLSISEEVYNSLVEQGKKVLIFDHHDTSKWLNSKPGCISDGTRCGTKLFYETVIKPRVGRVKPIVSYFIEMIDVYDRWVLDSPLRPQGENLQRVWTSYVNWKDPDDMIKNSRFISQMVRHLEQQTEWMWTATEVDFIRRVLEREEYAFQTADQTVQTRKDYKGNFFGIFKSPGKISITCSRLFKTYPNRWDYLIILQTGENQWGKLSLRSKGRVDLTTLATVGGHKEAAGATISPEEADILFNENVSLKYQEDYKEGESVLIQSLNF